MYIRHLNVMTSIHTQGGRNDWKFILLTNLHSKPVLKRFVLAESPNKLMVVFNQEC
jgi:hypothetical protein